MKTISKLAVFALIASLTACSSNIFTQKPVGPISGKPQNSTMTSSSEKEVGGSLRGSMDEIDRSKLYHGLDGALGKSTTWENPSTGISYTVTPVEKVAVGDNQICRKYTIHATRGGKEENFDGTACVGTDGNWSSAN